MKEIGLGYAELWDEPDRAQGSRADLSLAHAIRPWTRFAGIRKKFDDAGIDLYAFNYSFRDEFTDEQIEQGFLMAKALGVTRITASANVDISPRVDKYAQQYKIYVGYHNHDSMKPNEFSTPGRLEAGAGRPFEVHRHQPRHRALHRRGFRSGQLPGRAPRADRDAAHQGSQEESRPEHAVGRRRHQHQRRAAGV